MQYLLENNLAYNQLLKKMQLNQEENDFIFNAIKNIKSNGIVSYLVVNEVVSNDLARPLVAKFTEMSSTEISLVFLKRKENDYRCEIRSKTNYDVSKIAAYFLGGGHFNSAGFIQKDLSNLDAILKYINTKK
ncbi:Predicted phosphohydrolase (DHH superfamily) [Metamycoplasma alkalescens]|nr:Predicted phosphohydrolase (DHH superfamily) [Metamycoplasma alkalescens]